MSEVRETAVVLPGGVLQFEDKPRFLRDLARLAGRTVTVHVFVGMSPQSQGYYRGVVLPAIAECVGESEDEMSEILELKFNPVLNDGYVEGAPFEDLSAEQWSKVLDHIIFFGRRLGADIRPPSADERKESPRGVL